MKIIGFSGLMGVGKSTAIASVRALHTAPTKQFKFAQPLYDIQEYIYDRIAQVYKPGKDFVKDRTLLQWVGTEWGRGTISESLWIDLWKAEVTRYLTRNPHAVIVCDDVRFDNEAEAIKAMGGKIIQLTGPSRTDTGAGISGHASENGIDSMFIDATIDNSGPIEDLKRLLEEFNATHRVW